MQIGLRAALKPASLRRMASQTNNGQVVSQKSPLRPAEPLWQVAPTRRADGRCLADFMMLIPGLAGAESAGRRHVSESVRSVCEGFGDAVAFAEINYRLNLLWVSVEAEPGLSGRVASAIRERLPDALLVGGQLGAMPAFPAPRQRWRAWVERLRSLPRPLLARLPRRPP
ncbi:MAG: hypothetical protein PVF93_01085 [Chromatiaceae bacterium]